jgi:hypothetical protein
LQDGCRFTEVEGGVEYVWRIETRLSTGED